MTPAIAQLIIGLFGVLIKYVPEAVEYLKASGDWSPEEVAAFRKKQEAYFASPAWQVEK